MIRALGLVALAMWSGGVALTALAFLHGELRPGQAALCGTFGWVTAQLLAPTWVQLPRFVTGWLAAGVATVGSLLGVIGSGLGSGVAYAVLRGPELGATIVATGLVGSLVAALGYTHQRLAVEVSEQAARVARLREAALQAHLSALTAQVNPHFLFNTLNTLAEVVHEDADAAEDLVTDLAHMMRYVLRSTARPESAALEAGLAPSSPTPPARRSPVRLGEEIEVVRRFLRLEGARLRDRLHWTVDIAPEAEDIELPGLLVQPLVDNAVRYAVADDTAGGRVRVSARVVDVEALSEGGGARRLRIEVADDGPGLPEAIADALHEPGRGTEGAGGGLYTTAERLRLAWPPGTATIRASPGPDGRGTRIVLEVPVGGPR